MDPTQRIIVQMPLEELWTDDGPIKAKQNRSLTTEDVAELLRQGTVRFVVADVGGPLKWIAQDDGYEFWKSEVHDRVAVPEGEVRCWEYPLGYCYFASEWLDDEKTPIVLLEVYH